MRRIAFVGALVLVACSEKGPDPEVARLRQQLESLRQEFDGFRVEKEREVEQLRKDLAGKEQSGLAEVGALTRRFEELQAASETAAKELQDKLSAASAEATAALALAEELEKAKDGLAAQLQESKGLLDKRTAELDAIRRELAKLKALLGR